MLNSAKCNKHAKIEEKSISPKYSFISEKMLKTQKVTIETLLPKEFLATNVQKSLRILGQLQQGIEYEEDIGDVNIFKEIINELHTLRL